VESSTRHSHRLSTVIGIGIMSLILNLFIDWLIGWWRTEKTNLWVVVDAIQIIIIKKMVSNKQ
jgi:hypothetical protein